jgi:hypothetical protein
MRTKQPRLNRRLDLDVDGANHIYLLYYTNDARSRAVTTLTSTAAMARR